jgi:uncharacterized membrane protein
MDGVVLARALHVLAIVIWIGGVAMVTTVILPAARRGDLGADRLAAFEAFERRFAWQARLSMLVAGLTGLYMTARLDARDRFAGALFGQFWWMHAMVCLWLIFAFILFVAEPLVLHHASRSGRRRRRRRPSPGSIGCTGCCSSSASSRSSAP